MLYFVKFFVVFLGIFCYLLCNYHISPFSNHKTPVLTLTFPIYWHKKRVLKTELFFAKYPDRAPAISYPPQIR